MRDHADLHRRMGYRYRRAGKADIHFRGRNERMWARVRVITRRSSLRQVHRENHRMWGKDNEFCLYMVV